MGGSPPEAPTLPDAQPVSGVRASDAERDEVVAKLTEEFAAGRLSQDTFLFRMSAVLEARHQADLPPLLADLPSQIVAPGTPAPVTPGPPTPVPVPPAPAAAAPAAAATAMQPGADSFVPGAQARAARGPLAAAPGASAAGQARLVSRLRSVFPRRNRPEDTRYGDEAPAAGPTGSGPTRRQTGSMPRAPQDPPAVLRFPRGTATRFSIGRDASCDLAIADMTVSRVHARLERTEDGWVLTDLDSTNGTRVNGWRVRGQVQVHAGDLVSFGNAEYSLSAAEAT